MTEEEIKEASCIKYGNVATNPNGSYIFLNGRKFAVSVGYPKKLQVICLSLLSSPFLGSYR
jgi:hypothetical protein